MLLASRANFFESPAGSEGGNVQRESERENEKRGYPWVYFVWYFSVSVPLMGEIVKFFVSRLNKVYVLCHNPATLHDLGSMNLYVYHVTDGLDLSICRIVVLTEAFALVSGPVDEHLGWNNRSKWYEHLHQFRISKLLGQVIDEQVAAFRSWYRASYHLNQSTSKHLSLKYNTQVSVLLYIFVIL